MSKVGIMSLFKIQYYRQDEAVQLLKQRWHTNEEGVKRQIVSSPTFTGLPGPTRFSEKELSSYFTHCTDSPPFITPYFIYEQLNLDKGQLELVMENNRTQERIATFLSDRISSYDISDFDQNGLLDLAVFLRNGAMVVFYTQLDEESCRAEKATR